MSNEFKDMDTAPTLTLEPFAAQEEKKTPVAQAEEQALDDSVLTEEERRMVDTFAGQIDLTNSAMVLQSTAQERRRKWRISQSLHWKMYGQKTLAKWETCSQAL